MKKKIPIPKLIKKAERVFNAYIRKRDAGKPCISCGNPAVLQAGHYYKVQICSMRFDEMNVNGEGACCNCFDIDHLIGYRKGLVERYGEDHVKILDIKYEAYKRNGWKWEREYLESIIEKYS